MHVSVRLRTALAIVHDVVAAGFAWCAAFWLRLNLEVPEPFFSAMLASLAWVVPLQAAVFWMFGLYRGIWRYASVPDVQRIVLAVLVAAMAVAMVLMLQGQPTGVPRSVLILDPLLLAMAMGGSRMLYRILRERRQARAGGARSVFVLGAGDAAAGLIKEFSLSGEWRVAALFDDNAGRHGRSIHGVKVFGALDTLRDALASMPATHAIIAMPSAGQHDRKRAADLATAAGLQVLTVPSFNDLVSGKVTVSQIRAVELDDLLGRDPVVLDSDGLRDWITGRVVMVTGAGGSIGSELCRQIARFGPRLVVMVESSEFALYQVEQEFNDPAAGTRADARLRIAAVAGDVRSPVRMAQVMRQYRPTVVLHAAAYKHVPLMEAGNCAEAVLNNVGGTWTVARAAIDAGVEKFVLISTDKAVNPTNVMGATKRLAEIVCERLQEATVGTRFVMVRFGNVLGSAGSVIPRFRDQIAAGGPVTVTHPEITRFFMSIPEAAQLVLQAGLMGRGGEIFVLDMGEPVRIADLARSMIRLSGFAEDEIRIVYSGLRPGEKLFEELLAGDEHTLTTPHPKLRIAQARQAPEGFLDQLGAWLEALRAGASDDAEVKQRLAVFVPEYSPQGLHPVGPGRTEHAGNAR